MGQGLAKAATKLLPGYNCGGCDEKRCDAFAEKLALGESSIERCAFLGQKRFADNMTRLSKLLGRTACEHCNSEDDVRPGEAGAECAVHIGGNEPVGLIDGYKADFELKPLPGEPSCREVLFPFSRAELKPGVFIKYRPLGCPVIHFAKVLEEYHGLITVHMTGPMNRMNDSGIEHMDIGVCIVGGFEGIVEGKLPFVGQTVRFIPHQCMMRKVHSGVVVQLIGKRIIIEGIDLKVWAPPL